MAETSNYDFLFQFDGNLTDDSQSAVALTVDSGTPAYVTGDHGQALTVDSAALSRTIPNYFVSGGLVMLNFNVRRNTGNGDGVLFSIDNGTKGCIQAYITATSLYVYNWVGAQNIASGTVRNLTADQWEVVSIVFSANSAYWDMETQPLTSFTNYLNDSYWTPSTPANDWEDFEQCELYVGKAVNTVGLTQSYSGGNVAPSGVDLDWFCMDRYNEDRTFTVPLGTDFGVRTDKGPDIANYDLITHPTPISVSITAPTVELRGPSGSGGGGPVIPAQKEFWS